MFGANFYDEEDMPSQYRARNRRFDEFLRCYPVVMMPGAERADLNHGGKVIMPPSALDKLSRLHIAYPMLFELHNASKDRTTHAGVLEFIAEEGRVYLPHWMMQTLLLEPGELLQIKSTDLPAGTFIKLRPQSMAFITSISDPKAVLENALRTFSALTVGDVFSFSYNEEVFEIEVLEVKPAGAKGAIATIETDIEVDFAAPVGYVEPSAPQAGGSRPGSVVGGRHVTPLGESSGSMARRINYATVAPTSAPAVPVKHTFFAPGGGQKLKGSKTSTPKEKPSTPVAGMSSNTPPPASPAPTVRRGTGPQPLRLPPGQLFFGYEIKSVKKKDGDKEGGRKESMFSGSGQTLRGGGAAGKKRKGDEGGKGKGKNVKSEVIEID